MRFRTLSIYETGCTVAISYEAQQPFDERTYTAYAAAQARAADRDFALKAGAQAQQAAHQSSALAQSDEHFIESQRQQAGLAQQQMAHQAAMQDSQHQAAFGLQQARQNFEFTQADNLRLQRINQDAAGWEQLHSSGEITDQEFAQGQQMLNRQQMPLQARRDAAQAQHLRKQNELLDEQSAREATRESINARHANGTAPEIHTDEDGNQFLWRPTGWEQLRPSTTGQSGQPRPIGAAQLAGLRRSADATVARNPELMGRPQAERDRAAQALVTRWTQQPGAENMAEARPITLPRDTAVTSREFRALPADQRDTIRSMNEMAAIVTGPESRLPEDVRTEAGQDINHLRDLYFQFGSIDAMPPAERREAESIARRLEELKQQSLRLGPGQAARPPASSGNQFLGRYGQYNQGYTIRQGGPTGGS